LIFWNTDWDRLAAVLGEDLQNNPLEGVKVIEYKGNKDWPGIHKKELCEKYPYVKDIPDKFWDDTWEREEQFYTLNIEPYILIYNNRYKPRFSVELHSTLSRNLRLECDFEYIIKYCDFNEKMASFLNDNFINKRDDMIRGLAHSVESLDDHIVIDVLYRERDDNFSSNDLMIIRTSLNELVQSLRFNYHSKK